PALPDCLTILHNDILASRKFLSAFPLGQLGKDFGDPPASTRAEIPPPRVPRPGENPHILSLAYDPSKCKIVKQSARELSCLTPLNLPQSNSSPRHFARSL